MSEFQIGSSFTIGTIFIVFLMVCIAAILWDFIHSHINKEKQYKIKFPCVTCKRVITNEHGIQYCTACLNEYDGEPIVCTQARGTKTCKKAHEKNPEVWDKYYNPWKSDSSQN